MLRHVALFRLAPDAPADIAERLSEGLSALPSAIPEIERYAYGRDLGLREGNFDFAVVADFDSEEAFRTYVDHPAHQAFLTDQLTPVLSERVSIQFDL